MIKKTKHDFTIEEFVLVITSITKFEEFHFYQDNLIMIQS